MVAAQNFVVLNCIFKLREAEEDGGQAIAGGRIALVKFQDLLIVVDGGVDVAGPLVAKGQGKAEPGVRAEGL